MSLSPPATLPLDLVDELRATGADFHRRGWSLATSSNYSVVLGRDPLELLVTVSGKDKGRLEREDFVRVDANGQPCEINGPKSSAETLLHCVLADELPDIGAVLHTHSVWGTILSDLAGDNLQIAGYEMLKALQGNRTHQTTERLRVFDNTQDIPALAEQVRSWLQSCEKPPHGFLIRKHGLYTWGRSLAAARHQIEAFEFLFECEGKRRLLTTGVS